MTNSNEFRVEETSDNLVVHMLNSQGGSIKWKHKIFTQLMKSKKTLLLHIDSTPSIGKFNHIKGK